MQKRSSKFYDCEKFGMPQIRAYFTKSRITKKGVVNDPSVLLKCGCCNEKVRIYWGGGSIEINGVHGSIDDWEAILGPMLDKDVNKEDAVTRRK